MNRGTESYPNPEMGKRVRSIRGTVNQGEFGKKVGTSQGNVSKIERGMIPYGNILLRIAQQGETTIEYLLTGARPVRASIVSHDEKNLPAGLTLIKKLKGPASAGAGLVPNDEVDVQLAFRDDWLTKFGGPEKLVAMVIEGDSMEPTLNDKDVVVVNKNISAVQSGGGVYSLVWQGKRMVKRLQFNPKTKVVKIKSDNLKYDDFDSSLKDIKIEGKLIWFGREMK
ncbi:MAG: LexA family transcriptional regulator [Nitrospina sp.]|jgi:phage repressor protein C with HTH and peptisase S24 domain|nr:LexA family transcriptional regulator [Nitrospina sp.]MBT5633027.1 LexA family transcriptional regulator [Nitrospina sp.]